MAFNKDKVMDSARKFVDKNQLDKAVQEYLRIVKEDPKDVRVWLKIGDLYAKTGAKQDATETYLKVAEFYNEDGFHRKAVAVYQQILKLDPRQVDVNLKLAESYRHLGLMSAAMQHFEAVAAHFHREGNTKEARATVKKLVELDPENVATRIKLAELYSKENLAAEAIEQFTIACEQLRKQHRQEDFLKVAERLLFHQPENIPLTRELAGLYLARQDARRALQKLQIAFKADQRDIETLGMLAQAFQALDQTPKTVSVLKELAKIHLENKDKGKANDVYRKILGFQPDDPDAAAFLGDSVKPRAPSSAGSSGAQPVAPAARPPMPPPRPTPTPPPGPPVSSGHAGALAAASGRDLRAKLNLTAETSRRSMGHMTGSMPLVDEHGFSGDFSLPDYGASGAGGADEQDFSAELKGGRDARAASAAGEKHAEEISKVLAETDVYVKYGLHTKAIEHIRRVFALDPNNLEAREKLKDILISQGREQDAVTELLRLAEHAAPSDPERAEGYLVELLGLDGTHAGAHALAQRYRLRLSLAPSELNPRDSRGDVAMIDDGADLDLDDLEFGRTPKPVGVARDQRRLGRDDELAHGSPALGRRPVAPAASLTASSSSAVDGNFQLDAAGLDLDGDAARPAAPPAEPWRDDATGLTFADAKLAKALEAQLADEQIGRDIDRGVHDELRGRGFRSSSPAAAVDGLDEAPFEDLPFDPDEARAFDAGVARARTSGGMAAGGDTHLTGYEATEVPSFPPIRTVDSGLAFARHADDAHLTSTYADGPQLPSAADLDAGMDQDVDGELALGATSSEIDPPHSPQADAATGTARISANEEDELDEADFYVGQELYAEALDVLRALKERFPNHRMVAAKLEEVEQLASGLGLELNPATGSEVDGGGTAASDDDGVPMQVETSGITGQVDLDELEEVNADDLDDDLDEPLDDDLDEPLDEPLDDDLDEPLDDDDALAGLDEHSGIASTKPVPRHEGIKKKQGGVLLDSHIDEGDAATHYDLGLAYKEMGLFDEAIKAFDKAHRAKGKEVQCRMMMGICQREQGNPSDAVHHFKQGLHAAQLTERERQSLFYEIGVTYEQLQDPDEALYYLDMVVKREPNFADAAARVDRLRSASR